MGEFSQLQVWRDPAIAGALVWYRQVAENRMPAKFRIAATIPLGQFYQPVAYRKALTGFLSAPYPVMWNLEKK